MCPVGAGIWQGMHVHHYVVYYGLHTRSLCHVGSKHLPNGIVSVSALTIFTKLHLITKCVYTLFYKECTLFSVSALTKCVPYFTMYVYTLF